MYRAGIDIGSKTIKLVLVDDAGESIFVDYARHMSEIQRKIGMVLRNLMYLRGDLTVSVSVSGSAGMSFAKLLGLPFVQEVVALRNAVQELYPSADVALEMGGEDTKLLYLTGGLEQRMNTVCAGGTGGFIDLMASLMGVDVRDMNALAKGGRTCYPIASRCAVFAKSDIRPLVNEGVDKHDLAYSVLRSVCRQAIAGLSCGRPIAGNVLLLGGPFHHIPALRDAFVDVSGLDPECVTVPKDAHVLVALGAAFDHEKSAPLLLSELLSRCEALDLGGDKSMSYLPALFSSEEEKRAFYERHDLCHVPRVDIINAKGDLFLGVDAGSTTMKVALVDSTGALIKYYYAWNEGDVVWSLGKMIKEVYRQLGGKWTPDLSIARSCIVGYGEDYCRTAFGIDYGEVETLAHLQAARTLVPDVDFLLDIGGQDIKSYRICDGVLRDVVLNEACSSGCGSLFDSIARSLRITKGDLMRSALKADSPMDLGSRCTVFMESKLKHAQKEGASVGDMGAGIVYATAKNAINRVVRDPHLKSTVRHGVVQGGAFANDALLRAFELVSGCEVARPDLAEIMGAWGAALLARERYNAEVAKEGKSVPRSSLIGPGDIDAMSVATRSERCSLCQNACKLSVSTFSFGRGKRSSVRVSGNMCMRGAAKYGSFGGGENRGLPNLVGKRSDVIQSAVQGRSNARGASIVDTSGSVVGVLCSLSLYGQVTLWKDFLEGLGVNVLLSPTASHSTFDTGMELIPAESACYPSKMLYGQARKLFDMGCDYVFAPVTPSRIHPFKAEDCTIGCPVCQRYPLLLEDAFPDEAGKVVGCDLSQFSALSSDDDMQIDLLADALAKIGVRRRLAEIRESYAIALQSFGRWMDGLADENEAVLSEVVNGNYPGVMLLGHAYHFDPGISHGIDRLLSDLGYAVIDGELLAWKASRTCDELHSPWSASDALLDVVDVFGDARIAAVLLRSFGCRIDSYSSDLVEGALRGKGVSFAVVRLDDIVDLAAVRIRMRSLEFAHVAAGQSV